MEEIKDEDKIHIFGIPPEYMPADPNLLLVPTPKPGKSVPGTIDPNKPQDITD